MRGLIASTLVSVALLPACQHQAPESPPPEAAKLAPAKPTAHQQTAQKSKASVTHDCVVEVSDVDFMVDGKKYGTIINKVDPEVLAKLQQHLARNRELASNRNEPGSFIMKVPPGLRVLDLWPIVTTAASAGYVRQGFGTRWFVGPRFVAALSEPAEPSPHDEPRLYLTVQGITSGHFLFMIREPGTREAGIVEDLRFPRDKRLFPVGVGGWCSQEVWCSRVIIEAAQSDTVGDLIYLLGLLGDYALNDWGPTITVKELDQSQP